MTTTHPSCSSQPSRLTLFIRSARGSGAGRPRPAGDLSPSIVPELPRRNGERPALERLLATATQASPYSPADLLLYERLSEPDLSPNENWAAYVVSKKLEGKDAYESQVWLVDIQSREASAVTAVPGAPLVHNFLPAANGSLSWQTLKKREKNRPPSLLLPLERPGALACVSDAEDGVLDFAWAPDSQSLALVVEPDIDPSLDHIPEDTEAPIVLDRLLFKHDNAGYLKNTKQQIVLLSLDTKVTTPLTSPNYDSVLPAFSQMGPGSHLSASAGRS